MRGFIKFLKMFLASIFLFLILASIDDYKALILPFFMKEGNEKKALSIPKVDEEVAGFIRSFNTLLSQVYLSSDPARVGILPVNDSLKNDLAEEIDFLGRNNKVMDISVRDTKIEEVTRLSPLIFRVKAKETVSLSYLNLSDRSVVMPEKVAEYQTVYTLEMQKSGWIVVGVETVDVKGKE